MIQYGVMASGRIVMKHDKSYTYKEQKPYYYAMVDDGFVLHRIMDFELLLEKFNDGDEIVFAGNRWKSYVMLEKVVKL